MAANTLFKLFVAVCSVSALFSSKHLYTSYVSVESINLSSISVSSQKGEDVTIKDWQYLIDGNNISHVNNFKKMSGRGCGFAMQVHYSSIKGHTKFDEKYNVGAFFKAAYPKNTGHWDAESHLREVKACYLDEILGTRAVPPCVGYRLHYQDVSNFTLQQAMSDNLQCEHARASSYNGSVEGSLQFWQEGTYTVDRFEIFQAASQSYYKNNFTVQQHESAVRYAVFLYLGACMKSHRNHFAHNDNQFIAIDNDRCLLPDAIYSSGKKKYRIEEWRSLVFDICDFPIQLRRSIGKLTSSRHSSLNISERLVKAFEGDELSNELLMSQPEAFQEIDTRAFKLARHISQCIGRGKLAVEDDIFYS